MNTNIGISLLLLIISLHEVKAQQEKKVAHDFELELEAEYRYFVDGASFEDQVNNFPAFSISPEYSIQWNSGRDQFKALGFFRIDRDKKRTHWDIRELFYQKAHSNWELSIGLKKVYWGVAESNHLVDIINQTDQVESFDGEEKLGQPMLQYTLVSNKLGTFEFFYLPFHRRRTFAGNKGRLRFPIVIDKNDLSYESNAEEWRQDVAFRWSHYMGIVDIGISHFYGNGREPLFTFLPSGSVQAFYPVINQTGLDFQVTHNAFLWKLESIYRQAKLQDMFAVVAGVEYTFSNVDGNGLDIGILSEYLYDDRDDLALSALQNDLFFGSRIAFNDSHDSSILIGGIVDLDKSSKILSLEASRRIGTNWTGQVEARIFSDIDNEELLLSNFRQDSFLRLAISKYF